MMIQFSEGFRIYSVTTKIAHYWTDDHIGGETDRDEVLLILCLFYPNDPKIEHPKVDYKFWDFSQICSIVFQSLNLQIYFILIKVSAL